MKQIVLRFGLLALCLGLLLQMGQYSLVTRRFSDEWMVALFAVLFIGFGFLVSRYVQTKAQTENKKLMREDALLTKVVSKREINQKKIEELAISKREYEVLELIALGHSNKEIAKQLFISESTVKTHVSNLLQKLDAKRRTQAVKAAKEMQII